MYRVNKRSLSVWVIIAAAVLGIGYYVIRFAVYGSTWASAPFNRAAYQGGMLSSGTVTDRNGIVLADIKDGKRTFSEDKEIRLSVLHAVGDREGNIGTGALVAYAPQLMGYNPVTGSYSAHGSSGRTLALTIDAQINLEAYRALNGRRGAVMVSNYETGEVLCMVSSPGFDPSDPPVAPDDETGIYLNRAIQAAYTPGSVFKLVTAAAAIEQIDDIYGRTFQCDGSFEAADDTVTCSSRHGKIDFPQALQVSCNVVFGQLAIELGADTLADYAKRFGLTESISVGGINTMKGNFTGAAPGTADLAWSGVGQYMNLVCPAAMLRFVSAIANDGNTEELQLISESGISSVLPNASSRLMPRDTARQLGDMMEVQNSDIFPGLMIYAKSGTAQVSDKDSENIREPHAWYTGYITNPGHPYAFIIIVENGGGGTAVAAPIANKVLQKMVS